LLVYIYDHLFVYGQGADAGYGYDDSNDDEDRDDPSAGGLNVCGKGAQPLIPTSPGFLQEVQLASLHA